MRRYRAILAQDGVETSEGWLHRSFPTGCFTWEPTELPITMRAVIDDQGGHFGAFPIGAMEVIQREGNFVVCTGFLDDEGIGSDGDRVRHVIHLIDTGVLNRISVDPGNGGIETTEECISEDADGFCQEVRITFDRYSIGAATVVATPGLQGTLIELLPDEVTATDALNAVAAAAAEARAARASIAPLSFFDNPGLSTLTRIPVVTEDGRVYGHLNGWDECHLNFPMNARDCQGPWRSATGYSRFHVASKMVEVEGGGQQELKVGPLAVSGGHYPTTGDMARQWREAQAHYDDPATCVAYVRVGEDEHGQWFSGALVPGVTAEQVEAFSSHPLSIDVRRIDGSMELIGACSVLVPGFSSRVAYVASAAEPGAIEPVAAVVGSVGGRRPCCDECATSGESCTHGATASAAHTRPLTPVMAITGGLVDSRLRAEVTALRGDVRALLEAFEPEVRARLRARMHARV